MSPLMLLVFSPVLLGVVGFGALLLGAATAGAWETAEGDSQGPPLPPAEEPAPSPAETHAKAA